MDRCLVAGHVNWDVTLRVDTLPRADGEATIRTRRGSGGGSAANVAVGLSGLGVDVSILGSVGDDEYGARLERSLDDAGIDCAGLVPVSGAETAVKYLLVDDEGAVSILGNNGANEALESADVDPTTVRRADHVHLTSQRPDTARYIADVAAEAGVSVSFDPGRRIADRTYDETIERADVLFLTGREAEALRGSGAGGLAFGERIVVVTAGDDGAVVHAPDGTSHHAGYDVPTVDTSGAGDAFAAGFLTAWWDDGDCDRALRVGNACGAVAAARNGAQTTLTRKRIARLVDDLDAYE